MTQRAVIAAVLASGATYCGLGEALGIDPNAAQANALPIELPGCMPHVLVDSRPEVVPERSRSWPGEETSMFTDQAAILQAAATIASARIIARGPGRPIVAPPSAGGEIRQVLVSMAEAGLISAQMVPLLPSEEEDAA